MEPDSNLRLRRQTAGRHHPHRWSRQPEESGRNASQTLEDRKDENGETASQHRSRSQQYTEEGRFANTLFGLLFEGNQNCCLIETAPQIPVTPATPRPEPEIHKTVDMFEDDQELKEQARLARLKKEEEEKEARAAAKEAERLRKQKEKEEKERRKREAGPSWIQRKIDSLTKEIFSDDDMK